MAELWQAATSNNQWVQYSCRKPLSKRWSEKTIGPGPDVRRAILLLEKIWRIRKERRNGNVIICYRESVNILYSSLLQIMKMSSAKVGYLYDLMDAAYDAGPIYEISKGLGHVPIIDKNSRGKEVVPMAPHEATRYNERTASERFNSRMKEEFGANNVMVRGAQKVKMHLMFGILALFADQLIKLVT